MRSQFSNWSFLQTTDNAIILAVTANGVLQPMLGFPTAEIFSDFIQDAQVAFESFVPKTVRDAMATLDAYDEQQKKGGALEQGSGPQGPQV